MGSRYAVIAVSGGATPEDLASSLGLEVAPAGTPRFLEWPAKYERDEAYGAVTQNWAVLALPYQAITAAGYDLRGRASRLPRPNELLGLGVEDTAAEFWFQHLTSTEQIARHLEVEGQVLVNEGAVLDLPRDGDTDVAWNLLFPPALRADALARVPFQAYRVSGVAA